MCVLNQPVACSSTRSQIRQLAELLSKLRKDHNEHWCELDSNLIALWLKQQIVAGHTPWQAWNRLPRFLTRLLDLLNAADKCHHPQVHLDLNSDALPPVIDLIPLLGLLQAEGIAVDASRHIALRLVHLRYLYGHDRFGFYTELLHQIYNNSRHMGEPGEVLGVLLGVVHSPVLKSPYEPFYFTPAQVQFFCVVCIGLVLLFFAFFFRRVLLPRLRRRFSSFK
jgi:hypothetical protein